MRNSIHIIQSIQILIIVFFLFLWKKYRLYKIKRVIPKADLVSNKQVTIKSVNHR